MVAKKKTITARPVASVLKKGSATKQIRVGIIIGPKDFDPVKKGTQWPEYPKQYISTNDDWGKYSIDAATALRMKHLHPDVLDIDIIVAKDVNQKRLQKNDVNLNFWGDLSVAILSGKKERVAEVQKCMDDPDCRLSMGVRRGGNEGYYDWILNKSRYMETCIKAGIPMIPTVFYKNGFSGAQCLKDLEKKGWDKFFCKVGKDTFFGLGAINGKTEDFKPGGKKAKELAQYEKDNKDKKVFLLQPYMLKPNGEVFDEVRNFFIDGEWRYSVFTHGTDPSDAGYYQEPEGPRKAACKALAERAFKEIVKMSKWEGKPQNTLLNRIDIGVIPKRGADSLHKTDNQYFVNELELICTTWLDRYAPISVSDVMAQAATKHSLELVTGLVNSKAKLATDRATVKKCVEVLNKRLGPFKHIKIKA